MAMNFYALKIIFYIEQSHQERDKEKQLNKQVFNGTFSP
jgi:hypothetical protein